MKNANVVYWCFYPAVSLAVLLTIYDQIDALPQIKTSSY